MKTTETVLAWHFTSINKRLRYGDNRLVQAGKTLKARLPTSYDAPTLCSAGMHGSVNLMDALKYAPGPYLWRVEISGRIVQDDDKCCADSRKALWGFDATSVLRDFARQCALDVIDKWDAPEVVRNYLRTGNEAFRAAAWDAARAATQAAARAAAWDAARDSQNTRLHAMVLAEAKSRGVAP